MVSTKYLVANGGRNYHSILCRTIPSETPRPYIHNIAKVSSVSRVSGKLSSLAIMNRHMPGSDNVSMCMRSLDSAVSDKASRLMTAIIIFPLYIIYSGA